MKVSDLLKHNVSPFLYGAIMSRIMTDYIGGKKYFYLYTSFKSSKAVPQRIFSITNYGPQYVQELNFISGIRDWKIHRCNDGIFEGRLYLENDLALTETSFYNLVRSKLFKEAWIHEEGLTDDKKDFIRGFIELRGSVDTTAKFIAQDYFFNNRIELKKALIVTDFMSVPIKYANYNMRNLQFQYCQGINKRNPQFRIHSYYYAKYIGFLNKYKALIFKSSFNTLGTYTKNQIQYFSVNLPNSNDDDVAFVKYLNFFSNNIYEKSLTPTSINDLRKRMGFSTDSANNENSRNRTIISIFDEISPDKCAICGTEKTYTKPDGKQYFEIHHVIARCNGKEFDNIANLVKLCPTCHRMMKKNGSPANEQVKSIIKILSEHQEIFEFCSSYLNIDNINTLAEKIQQMLG